MKPDNLWFFKKLNVFLLFSCCSEITSEIDVHFVFTQFIKQVPEILPVPATREGELLEFIGIIVPDNNRNWRIT